MIARYLALLLALFIGMRAASALTISKIDVKGEQLLVSFDKGAVWACTVFQQQVVGTPDQNWSDGRYAPRHCWSLYSDATSYDDNWNYIKSYDTDWLVWAEVGYPALGVDVIQYTKTNVLEIHR